LKLGPNCEGFKIELGDYDEVFDVFGVIKRKEAIIKIKPHKNKHVNKYVIHQLLRLKKHRTNPKLY